MRKRVTKVTKKSKRIPSQLPKKPCSLCNSFPEMLYGGVTNGGVSIKMCIGCLAILCPEICQVN